MRSCAMAVRLQLRPTPYDSQRRKQRPLMMCNRVGSRIRRAVTAFDSPAEYSPYKDFASLSCCNSKITVVIFGGVASNHSKLIRRGRRTGSPKKEPPPWSRFVIEDIGFSSYSRETIPAQRCYLPSSESVFARKPTLWRHFTLARYFLLEDDALVRRFELAMQWIDETLPQLTLQPTQSSSTYLPQSAMLID